VQSQGTTDDDEGACVHPEVGTECARKSGRSGGAWVVCEDICACVWQCDEEGKNLKHHNVNILAMKMIADTVTQQIGWVLVLLYFLVVVV